MKEYRKYFKKKRKYYAVLCAIAKDEDRYLREWVAYHLAIGFEHIYIYDNMSRRRIERLFGDRMPANITVIRWPTIGERVPQLDAYEHFLWAHGGDSEWAAVLDLDEMLNLKADRDVRTFLRRFEDATAVAVNWRIFGSGGSARFEPDFVMRRFTKASRPDFWANKIVKTIYRTRYTASIGHHYGSYFVDPEIRAPSGRSVPNGYDIGTCEADFEVAQVNHYFVKSSEEWIAKLKRGYNDGTSRKMDDFQIYDANDVDDQSILRNYERTRRIAHGIFVRPRFGRLHGLLRALVRPAPRA